MSVLINMIMLFFYFRSVTESVSVAYVKDIPYLSKFVSTSVILKILGIIQLFLVVIVLFFWFVIDCPLLIKGKWRNVMVTHRKKLQYDGVDLS